MNKAVVIVGASVRAMASSARTAGWRVVGIDLFGDADLATTADAFHVVPFDEYPSGIEALLQPYAGLPVCYTGSLENAPELLQRIRERGPLWGNGAQVVRRVRDLSELHAVLISHGIRVPRTVGNSLGAEPNKRWLLKSNRSAGGMQVRAWMGEQLTEDEYLQEEIEGNACAALFLGDAGTARLLGVTRQILRRDLNSSSGSSAEKSFHGMERPFQYVGSIGPLSMDERYRVQLVKLGSILAGEFNLRGIFGVDWIDADGDVVVIEVNPRYVASAEVIEATLGQSLFDHHVAAFTESPKPPSINQPSADPVMMTGKLVVFAPSAGSVSPHAPCYGSSTKPIAYADIPPIGTHIPAGFPVLTLFTTGQEESSLFASLERAASDFLPEFFVPLEQSAAE